MARFIKETILPVSAEQAFAWHERPDAFDLLTPPWQRIEVLERPEGLADGTRLVFRLCKGPLRLRWVAEHRDVIPGRRFCDVQVEGPFAVWHHTHSFEPRASGGSVLRDEIEYVLPLGALGRWIAGAFVRRDLERTFDYRHRLTLRALS